MGKQRKGWLLIEAMNEWKLTGESNYAPVNAFPARNLRKGGHLGGNWIVAYNEEQQPRLERVSSHVSAFDLLQYYKYFFKIARSCNSFENL